MPNSWLDKFYTLQGTGLNGNVRLPFRSGSRRAYTSHAGVEIFFTSPADGRQYFGDSQGNITLWKGDQVQTAAQAKAIQTTNYAALKAYRDAFASNQFKNIRFNEYSRKNLLPEPIIFSAQEYPTAQLSRIKAPNAVLSIEAIKMPDLTGGLAFGESVPNTSMGDVSPLTNYPSEQGLSNASFLDPIFMLFESGISTPLQALGVKESTANSIAGWTVFAGSLFADKIGSVSRIGAAEELANAERTVSVARVAKGVQYTKSTLQLGQQMHKAYKVGDVVERVAMKEFREILGIRPDFVDFSTKTIYELKPFNPRAMQQGWKQLYKYQSLFEQNYGGTWNIVLDTY